MDHYTTVTLYQRRPEHRAECSCGWVGDYRETRHAAMADADHHTEPQRVNLGRVDRESPAVLYGN